MQQLDLFANLPIPPALPARERARHARVGQSPQIQFAFMFRLRELESDRDTDFDFPQHAVTTAAGTARPETTAPRSIFDLGAIAKAAAKGLRRMGRFGDAAGFKTTPAPAPVQRATIERSDGVTRSTGAAYPVRWTDEDHEREKERRARQRPPRPTKKARTRSEKLIGIIGTENDYED